MRHLKKLVRFFRGLKNGFYRPSDYRSDKAHLRYTSDRYEKGRLCAPCPAFCGDDLCQRVGCLNMDMRTNSLRLRLLIKRLDKAVASHKKHITPAQPTSEKVVNISNYRK